MTMATGNTLTTLEEAVAFIAALDLDRWTKKAIYSDITYGYSFGAVNEEALLTRRRTWALYTYLLPDGISCHIAGDLLNAMVDNARQRLRAHRHRDALSEAVEQIQNDRKRYNLLSYASVGDPVPGRLAEYGWVDYLAGGTRAAARDGGGGAASQAPQRRAGPASAATDSMGQAADGTGEGAVPDAGGDV
jgi:hypothetical protein